MARRQHEAGLDQKIPDSLEGYRVVAGEMREGKRFQDVKATRNSPSTVTEDILCRDWAAIPHFDFLSLQILSSNLHFSEQVPMQPF